MNSIEKYKYIFLLPIPITTLPAGEYKKFIYQMIGGVLFLDSYNIAYSLVSEIIFKITDSYISESVYKLLDETKEFVGDLKEEIL